jgi:hypothetical protein
VPKHEFEPVVLEEPRNQRLRRLFVGRIANALDSLVGFSSLLFGFVLVVGGVGLLSYNLYFIAIAAASRGAWLTLSLITILVLVVAFFLWRLPLITRLIILSVLAVLSFVASPILQRVLT